MSGKIITCIAEKPSVGKDIARVLGCTEAHDGYYSGYSKLLDAEVNVTWTFGHLCQLKLPHEYKPEWKQWNYAQLPLIPGKFQIRLKDNSGVSHQFNVIKQLFLNSDLIINCGDAGQEGELIQRWVIQKCGLCNPHKTTSRPVKRLWISSMTDEAILEGFKHLRDSSDYQHLYEAGLARACGDWMIGMSASRYYTMMGRRAGHQCTFSVGRVQTPTLAMIVKRQREIENFQPEDYYVLSTVYRDVVFQASDGAFRKKSDAELALESIRGKEFVVKGVATKKSNEAPPRLYDLTSLQVDMNRKYGYSADFTLTTLQSLYEAKLVTYPRVDTTWLPDDVYGDCPRILQGLVGYRDYVNKLNLNKLRKDKKFFDSKKVTDHHAIIPTGKSPWGTLTDAQINLYDDIVKHFIAAFYPDCTSSVTTVTGKVGEVEFKATGKQILDYGWYDVFGKAPEGKILPDLKKGESGPHTPTLTTRTTTPPPLYTEATLLRAMETAGNEVEDEELRSAMKANGIGRPSTRAAIIELLFKRGYIAHQKKNIIPTDIGEALVDAITDPLLKSPELTGQWEKKLREVEAGTYPVGQFMEELKDMTYKIVKKERQIS